MQTILGSNGQIGQELAKELYRNYTKNIRLVSRKPKKVNEQDQLYSADLLSFKESSEAIAGSDIVYFAVGLPMNSTMWEKQFPVIMQNVIKACETNGSKLVFFDNTYMYAKNDHPQKEDSPFIAKGRKALVRKQMAQMVLNEIEAGKLEAVICRAPEFYGPAKTSSITNTLVFNKIKQGKRIIVPLSKQKLRTLIWTPDASRAMALIGNTPDTYGQTWHLPCDNGHNYQELIEFAEKITGRKLKYTVIKMWEFKVASLFSKNARELQELLPRYGADNIFISEKFKKRFPDFSITPVDKGIKKLLAGEHNI
ncbi:NAD-dependent epimerase/dehydratase family protein [Ligilactobacillus acidipiscis]|uniref:NAD-dependent epimerase/dehydratase family protein n=1 Tax=Ligilactobacillus acidipiscis TaxID=89059 RepID=UPI0022DFE5D1|nr:NAD-dependent epimerase/dehydratase family protein [Ligilactobacillus acidipiscis]